MTVGRGALFSVPLQLGENTRAIWVREEVVGWRCELPVSVWVAAAVASRSIPPPPPVPWAALARPLKPKTLTLDSPPSSPPTLTRRVQTPSLSHRPHVSMPTACHTKAASMRRVPAH